MAYYGVSVVLMVVVKEIELLTVLSLTSLYQRLSNLMFQHVLMNMMLKK